MNEGGKREKYGCQYATVEVDVAANQGPHCLPRSMSIPMIPVTLAKSYSEISDS